MIDFFGFDFVGILILLCILIYLLFDLLVRNDFHKFEKTIAKLGDLPTIGIYIYYFNLSMNFGSLSLE
jgi:hypothetical protein